MAKTIDGPSGDCVAVTPHNTDLFAAGVCRGLYVGVTGNVKVLTEEGQTVTFQGVAAGTIVPIRVVRVNATDTTASGIIALY